MARVVIISSRPIVFMSEDRLEMLNSWDRFNKWFQRSPNWQYMTSWCACDLWAPNQLALGQATAQIFKARIVENLTIIHDGTKTKSSNTLLANDVDWFFFKQIMIGFWSGGGGPSASTIAEGTKHYDKQTTSSWGGRRVLYFNADTEYKRIKDAEYMQKVRVCGKLRFWFKQQEFSYYAVIWCDWIDQWWTWTALEW